ncbi:MAG: TolC family protein, partial [Magnetococcales bacterium]|nr:TolC family protein [Magnetococcales bacterium]
DENGQPLADQEAAAQAAQQAEEQGQQGPDTIWAYGEQGGSYTTPGYSGSDECITVDGVTVNSDMDGNGSCGQTLRYSVEDEYASFKAEEWSNTWSGMARVSKIFFWGGSVNAQVATTRFPPYKPSKSATVGALEVAQNLGQVEWSSSATVGMRTPVPFGKNFGSEGNFSAVQTNLSRLTMHRSELNQEATTNTVVRNALQAYWELVRALMQVEVSHKYRQTLVKNLARVQRLYDAGQATEYALLQARANLENSHNQEEIAWSTVVTRENNLSDLLNLPTKVVVVPEGFEKGLLEKSKVDANALLDKAMRERAEILVAKSDLDYQNLLLAYRKNQLLPDITLNATLGVGQSSSVFAYSSMSDSWSKLTDPDSMNYYVGFTWTVPWGDNKVRSEYHQARASHTQAMDREQQSLVRVAKEANGAIASFQSSQGREQLAKTNLNLANSALASAERQSELEMVTDFELLQRHQEVFKAQVEYVNSLLDQRVAQVSLQAASGELGRSGGSKPVGERP